MGKKKSVEKSDKESSLLQITRRSAGDSTITRNHSLANGRTAVSAISRRRKRKKDRRSRRTNGRDENTPYSFETRAPQISDALTMSGNIFLKLAGRGFSRPGVAIGKKEVFFYGTGIKQGKTKPQR